jgi:hypothetical protein
MREQLADKLWTVEGDPISFYTVPYELRMTVIRLADGSLMLHSPVQCTDETRRVVAELGTVRYLVSPNKLHHFFLGPWAEASPGAEIWASPGLREKRPDLAFAGELGDQPEPGWADDVDQCLFGGSFFMNEIVFFHRPSRSLILGDLIENHDPDKVHGPQRLWLRANRALAPEAVTPRLWQLTFWKRRAARRALARIRAWRPERVLVTHGPIIRSGGAERIEHSLGWAGRASSRQGWFTR